MKGEKKIFSKTVHMMNNRTDFVNQMLNSIIYYTKVHTTEKSQKCPILVTPLPPPNSSIIVCSCFGTSSRQHYCFKIPAIFVHKIKIK